MSVKPIVITSGEPAGIGPDLLIQIAQHPQAAPLVVIADPTLLIQRAEQLGLKLNIELWTGQNIAAFHQPKTLIVIPVKLRQHCICGRLNIANAAYVLETLDIAIEGCLSGKFAAMVTPPVHKSVINDAGIMFTGHTEYLALNTNTEKVVMMLASPSLKVALATTHLPLQQVSQAITEQSLSQVITILNSDLKTKFGISSPRIVVCGLNPHAGEDGHLGMEEIDTIIPTLEKLRSAGINLIGPIPADTAFTPASLKGADTVLAMYHDQGLPVLKAAGFGEAVNITLGLPIIRTSVDHGTALDLAGTGTADAGSLLTAIAMAQTMVAARV
jgi:4-hydroxythreonine-4-phosphate dehydrogenase